MTKTNSIKTAKLSLLQLTKLAKQKILAELLNNEEWKTVKFGEVLYPMETKKPSGTTFGYIDIDAIDNKQHIIKEPKIIDVANAPSRASRGLKFGDTLFSMVRPYLENIAFVEEKHADCIASTGFFVCRPNEKILPQYLYYLMLSPFVVDGLNSFMKGDNSPSINNNNITSFEISLPPLTVQHQIVTRIKTLFAEADRIEQSRARLLRNAKLAKQKVLAELLNNEEWKTVKLNNIADISLGKTLDKQKNTGDYKPYLRSVNVRWGEVDLSDLKEMKFEESETEKYTLQYNDLLICEGGEAGRCAIWKELEKEMRYQNALHRVRFKDGNVPDFYMYYIMYMSDTNNIADYCKGVTIKHLTGTALRQIDFPLPPLPVQHQIVEKIEKIFAEIERIERAVK
jgi:type I restriction enzyme S subunit